MKIIPKSKEKGESGLLVLFYIAVIVFVLALPIVKSYHESATYNKLTGAQTTWWDALWVELRVDSNPTMIQKIEN